MTTDEDNLTRLKICTVEGPDHHVEAMFNPKEIQIDKSIPWQKHKNSKGDSPDLEFTSAEGRVLSMELFFDTYETGKDVYSTYVGELYAMTKRMSETVDKDKHPPKVRVIWQSTESWFIGEAFIGVFEQLGVKYTMFLPNGTPVRATCQVKIREAKSTAYKAK
jgi:hypothetical protein